MTIELDFSGFYRGKRVFITGHTGFKGAWLTSWLLELGAEVTGFSKDVPTDPSLFATLALDQRMRHVVGDVRDSVALRRAMGESRPEVLFHLAAQALVRASYRDPIETFSTNVIGTANVLEAAREREELRVLVNITSDKCYENQEWPHAYRETDPMGGSDPYSASKGCAELVFSSYVRSFLANRSIQAASARAGNVIGGGDWAEDRLIPDCVRAWSRGEVVTLRNPKSVRPWQHVLEPLSGYLALGAALGEPNGNRPSCGGEAFNFGPSREAFASVQGVVEAFLTHWPSVRWEVLAAAEAAQQPKEARLLKLSVEKAAESLGWHPTLRFAEGLEMTAVWYHAFYRKDAELDALTRAQIRSFSERFLQRNGRLTA